jgi:chitodextrinase
LSLEDVCKKEIATLFAHFAQETGYHTAGATAPTNTAGAGQLVSEEWRQALFYLKELACDVASPSTSCDYYSTANNNSINYPRKDATTKYFGRGAFQLSWNYNYGSFSEV